MKRLNDQFIIGVDHGYGNIKTANHCFKTGILGYDSEPLFTGDMLTYSGRYYLIGEGHKEYIAEKIEDEDYYLLTLVAIAKELKNTFVNSVFVYDDKLVLTYNYKDGNETLTLQEIESVLSSNLTSMCPPKETTPFGVVFLFGMAFSDRTQTHLDVA